MTNPSAPDPAYQDRDLGFRSKVEFAMPKPNPYERGRARSMTFRQCCIWHVPFRRGPQFLVCSSAIALGCGSSPNSTVDPKHVQTEAGAGASFGLGGAANTAGSTTRTPTAYGGATPTEVTPGGSVGLGGRAIGGNPNAVSGMGLGGMVAAGGRSSGGATANGAGGVGTANAGAPCSNPTSYDQLVLCDGPVGYWTMEKTSGSEPDRTAAANAGTYRGGTLEATRLPNDDRAVVFDGASQYLTIASKPTYSISTTGEFVWEAWIRPSVLQFPNDNGAGYVDWMGKCADYSPTCEWEARMYATTNDENRCNRLSAYVFNPSAGLGSAADWQPQCGLIEPNRWYHVVGAYSLKTQPSGCANTTTYPGSIEIWVNGVQWNQARHQPTGCMSQYNVVPKAAGSPINIGTMASDGWFPGSIAKVALYDHGLSPAQIARHYTVMTGKLPTGSCANDCSF